MKTHPQFHQKSIIGDKSPCTWRKEAMRRVLPFLLVAVLMLSFFSLAVSFRSSKAIWSGIVYISSFDPPVYPPDAPITKNGSVYTLTDDIQGEIVIDQPHIVLDGAGHRLIGGGSNHWGVRTFPRAWGNITVMNLDVSGFDLGISLPTEGYPYWMPSTVIGCNITDNGIGLVLGPFNNTVIGNNITANVGSGIKLARSPYFSYPAFNLTFYLRNNTIAGNQRNLDFAGLNYNDFRNFDVDDSNTIDGKHVYCLFDEQNKTIPSDAGYVLAINCTEISGHDMDLSHNSEGLFIIDSANFTITHSNMTNCSTGVRAYSSSRILLQENSVLENSMDGIDVQNSSNIVISESNVNKNSVHGIYLYNSTSNTLSDNSLTSNANGGLWFNFSSNNRVFGNNISGSKLGFGFIGNAAEDFMDDVDSTNLIDGKPIYYLANISDSTVPSDAGYVALVNCSNIIVQNLNLANNINGLVTANCVNVTAQNLNLQGNLYSVMSTSTTNSTITHISVTDADYGVLMYDSSNFNQITENNITSSVFSISLQDSMNNSIARNTVIGSWDVHLKNSSGNAIESNALVSGNGMLLEDSNHNMITDNEVTTSWSSEGILVYGGVGNLFARNNISNFVEGIAMVSSRDSFVGHNYVHSCGRCLTVIGGVNVTLFENDLNYCNTGIALGSLDACSVLGNNISDTGEYGITFGGGQDSMISGNIIKGNFTGGIVLSGDCTNDTISGNNVYGKPFTLNGIIIVGTNNTVTQNLVSNTPIGVQFVSATNNTLSENTIEHCNREAVYLVGSTSTYIIRNSITDNLGYTLRFLNSDHNIIFGNNFVNNWNNSQILFESPSSQDWNASYPVGGNYWDSYSGTDIFQGTYQNQTGSDGMIDMPFVLDSNNTDQYPLTKPYSPHDIGLRLSFSKTVVAKGYNITLSINATIHNYDLQTQTSNFSYAMPGASFNEEVTISQRNSTTFNFQLNTTNFSYGYYYVQTSVSPVQNETDLSDNNLTRYIRIVVPGDVSSANQGVPDGTVNMRDIQYMILLFNTKPNSINWNPNADVNNDGTVNMRDIQIAILNFNKHE
jgi:parallel beta-helix repeat protein